MKVTIRNERANPTGDDLIFAARALTYCLTQDKPRACLIYGDKLRGAEVTIQQTPAKHWTIWIYDHG